MLPSTRKNKEIVTIENIEKHLNNWDIPKVGVSTVYNKGSFVLKSDYIIKTVEEALPITGEIMEVPLISQSLIDSYRKKYMLMDSSSSIRLAGRPSCFSLLEPNAFLDVILLRGSFCKHNLEPEGLLLELF